MGKVCQLFHDPGLRPAGRKSGPLPDQHDYNKTGIEVGIVKICMGGNSWYLLTTVSGHMSFPLFSSCISFRASGGVSCRLNDLQQAPGGVTMTTGDLANVFEEEHNLMTGPLAYGIALLQRAPGCPRLLIGQCNMFDAGSFREQWSDDHYMTPGLVERPIWPQCCAI